MRTATTLLIALVSALTSCASRVGELQLVSPVQLEMERQVIVRGVEGRHCARNVLFVPSGGLHPSLDATLADALRKVPGAEALANARFEQTTLFTFFYNRSCLRVRGDAIRTHAPTQPAQVSEIGH